jgi:Predicted Zn-dependent protease (DUF2268)
MRNKSIFINSALALMVISSVLFLSCSKKKTNSAVEFKNFNTEIDSLATGGISNAEFEAMKQKHGRFFIKWLNDILDFEKYGPISDSMGAIYLTEFLEKNKPIFKAVTSHYKRYPNLQNDISEALTNLNELMGGASKPVVYDYISQFSNYNTFVDTFNGKTIFAYSAEMFMGDTFPLYNMLEVPEFFRRYDSTEQIPAMMVWGYLKSLYDDEKHSKNMLSEAVLGGKIWYTMTQVFPDKNAWDLFGYSEQEWKQMNREEGQIWKHYLDQDMLFQADFGKYKRYFNYGNHTFGAGIPPDCPPLIGNFTGYRIVSEFMKKDSKKLAELWKEADAEKILRISGYNPIK